MKDIRITAPFGLLTAILALGVVGCNKEKDTIAEITVQDQQEENVSGALVHVFGEPSDTAFQNKEIRIDREKKTGTNGKAKFNFTELFKKGQAGFAVLDVEITVDTFKIDGFIKVKEEQKNTKTFTLE